MRSILNLAWSFARRSAGPARSVFLAVLIGSGCTTLGPMPATTGIAAIPSGRPGIEAQLGVVPSYHLSGSVSGKPRGSATGQGALLIEPDRWAGVPGLVAGARLFGKGEDTLIEPLIGYRHALDDQFAVAVFGYATSKRASSRGADYHAFRAGGEVAADGRLAAFTRWLSLHTQAAASLTRVVASGGYCVNATGAGKDCTDDDRAGDMVAVGRIRGVYPSGTATLALDIGRTPGGIFHSGRIALMLAAGMMPRATGGVQEDGAGYFSIGLTATLALGSADR
jgi:hypothetical protein